MKKKPTILAVGAVALALVSSSFARTWTSADGKNTFEGEFVSATDTQVTVKRSNGKVVFEQSKLSKDDISWIKEEVERRAAAAKAKEDSEKLLKAKVPKALSGKLVKLNDAGKRYEKVDLADGVVPKYYLVYFSASW